MSSKLSRILWPGLVFAFIGTNVLIVTITIVAANTITGGGAEPDYYRKAVNWDQTAAERSRSDSLNWSARIAATSRGATITIRDHAGAALDDATVEVEHFALLNPGNRTTTACPGIGEGRYSLNGPLPAGNGEFRIRATRGKDVFVTTLRAPVAQEGNP